MRAVRLLILLVGVAAILTGCHMVGSERDYAAFRLTNDTDAAVDVVFVSSDAPSEESAIFQSLGPHESVAIGDKFRSDACMSGVLIARTDGGDEVARRDEPVCIPGEWVIKRAP